MNTRNEEEWNLAEKRFHRYLMLERRLSPNTVAAYMHDVARLREFIGGEYDVTPAGVTPRMIDEFMTYLFDCDAEKTTQGRILSGVRSFFDHMVRTDLIAESPAALAEHPKADSYLPDTLSVGEIDAILATFDLATDLGRRNRAMVETLYSCGLRVSELVGLRLNDLFFDDGYIRVRGKGDKQRLVPVSDECRRRIADYLAGARPAPADARSSEAVFLNRRGRRLTRAMIFKIIRDAAAAAGIDKTISPHTFRHSFATHLLRGGANIRQVQDLLGHASITTTEIYTHLDTGHLRRTLNEHHPLGRHRNDD